MKEPANYSPFRCELHPRYGGMEKPLRGCPGCWYVWIYKRRFCLVNECDARYIARMQRKAKGIAD